MTSSEELSEKLAMMYGVDACTYDISGTEYWLAEDSGRISDLADENGISVIFFNEYVSTYPNECSANTLKSEMYTSHPTKAASARMARVRCLIAIKENE